MKTWLRMNLGAKLRTFPKTIRVQSIGAVCYDICYNVTILGLDSLDSNGFFLKKKKQKQSEYLVGHVIF